MKKSKQQHAVVYSGKIGAKMRAKRVGTSRAIKKIPFTCRGGPMSKRVLYLSTPTTLVFTLNGQKGRYVLGKWEEVA